MMTDEITTLVRSAGLDEKEATVYLACLQLGKDTAFNIAKKAEIKRSTAYTKLNDLNTKGLVLVSKQSKATVYQGVNPKKLLQLMDFRRQQLTESLPKLTALYTDTPYAPHIEILEGEQGLLEVNTRVVQYAEDHPNDDILAFGAVDYLFSSNARLAAQLAGRVRNAKIKTRQLFNDDDHAQQIQKMLHQGNSKNTQRHQIRVLPETPLKNDNIIYGNTLCIFSTTQNNQFVICIENVDIVHTYRTLFEIAWQTAS
jgi:predicted transcriptional regulator